MHDHISICICTYKRPEFLKKLLGAILEQNTNDNFIFSVVVIDNDLNASAKDIIKIIQKESDISITYKVEPVQNIARVRNLAISSASGNYIAFIDDDEIPIKDWIRFLYGTCRKYNVDGVLAPTARMGP